MKPSELNSMTKAELLALAKKLKIPADPRQVKSSLVQSIQGHLKKHGTGGRSSLRVSGSAKDSKKPRQSRTPSRRSQDAGTGPETKKADKEQSSNKKTREEEDSSSKKTGGKPASGKGRKRLDSGKKEKIKPRSGPPSRRGRGRAVSASRKPVHLDEAPGGLEAKFLVAQPFVQDEDKGHRPPELPAGYGQAQVALLPRDPQWAFAFWEIPSEAAHDLLARMGDSWERVHWVLRLYSPNRDQALPETVYDVGIDPFAIGWYLHLSPPGASFQAELGLRDSHNRFAALACSNILTLPPDRPSDVLDEIWRLTARDVETHYAAYPIADPTWLGVTGTVPEQAPGAVFSRPNPFDTR